MALLAEINGLIADMLAENALPLHVTSGLKALSQLLSLPNNSTASLPNLHNASFSSKQTYKKQNNHLRRDLAISDKSKVGSMNGRLLMPRQTHKEIRSQLRSRSSTCLNRTPSPSKKALKLQKTVFNFYPLTDDINTSLLELPHSSLTKRSSHRKDIERDNNCNNEVQIQKTKKKWKNPRVVQLEDGTLFNLEFSILHSEWNTIHEWDFPIFDVCAVSDGCILSQMCYRIFLEVDYFKTFDIPLYEFLNYFRALESGYRDIPYHNRTHASDVVHGVFYLTTQPIPGFEQMCVNGNNSHDAATSCCIDEENYGIIADKLPAIELMALYVAAAMHDCDHPGRSNAFLVMTHAPQAIMYNDISVLENHHAATAWSLLYSKPSLNFLKQLNAVEFKRFRFLVIEIILATDLAKHFQLIGEFNTKLDDKGGHKLDWKSESDRLMMMKMCIKLADVNGPCKERNLHFQWTQRIIEEFYEQGDEEAKLGLPISPCMDRKDPQLAKSQDGFIKFIVGPLCSSYEKSGLLPGRWIEEKNSENTNDSTEEQVNQTESLNQQTNSAMQKKPKRKICPVSKNLKENRDYWTEILEQEIKQKKKAEEDTTNTKHVSNII